MENSEKNSLFQTLSTTIEELRRCERMRSDTKKALRSTMRSQNISVNRALCLVKAYQSDIHGLSERIRIQRNKHNKIWNQMKYEDKVEYRYFANGEDYANGN